MTTHCRWLASPPDTSPSTLVDHAQRWSNLVQAPDELSRWHQAHEIILAVGLGGGARHMHSRYGADAVTPTLPSLAGPETLTLLVMAMRTPTDGHIDGEQLTRGTELFEQQMRREPDRLDLFMLEASRVAARVPLWSQAIDAWQRPLKGARTWFATGLGRRLAHQAHDVEQAWTRIGLSTPWADRMSPWARHLWVVSVVSGGLHD